MHLHNTHTGGRFRLINNNPFFNDSYPEAKKEALLTIAWNRGPKQEVLINGKKWIVPENALISLLMSQEYHFAEPKQIIAWQFNRQFYCIVDHDEEVSCVGLLFYGASDVPIISLEEQEVRKINLLHQVFLEEFENRDNLQEDMLRMLLKRLIITTTRFFKEKAGLESIPGNELDTVRHFNLLVEKNYKRWHQVQDYSNELNKSPKTLSNLFAKNHSKSPLKVIHQRIVLEAKRLLIYSDMSIKEIAYELGFDEVPAFNRIFKKITENSPTNFRQAVQNEVNPA